MKDKDSQLIFEAYLKEDRYAREHPEEGEDVDYAQRARAEAAMDRQGSLDDVAYDMIDTMGTEMEGHEVLEKLIRAIRSTSGELHGHVVAWKNSFNEKEGLPEGLKNYVNQYLFPEVEKWAEQGGNAVVRRGLGSKLDVLDGVLMMDERERLTMVDGPQD